MLNLPEFEVIKKEVNEHYYRFTIQATERPFMCTQCCWEELDLPIEDENKGKKFIIHSTKEREVANMYKRLIPIKLYEAMYKYKIEIND